jgi:hypothetical protein
LFVFVFYTSKSELLGYFEGMGWRVFWGKKSWVQVLKQIIKMFRQKSRTCFFQWKIFPKKYFVFFSSRQSDEKILKYLFFVKNYRNWADQLFGPFSLIHIVVRSRHHRILKILFFTNLFFVFNCFDFAQRGTPGRWFRTLFFKRGGGMSQHIFV